MYKNKQISPSFKRQPKAAAHQVFAPEIRLGKAISLHQLGKWAEAEVLYRAILTEQPENADVCHLLGLVALQRGKANEGIALITKAVQISPAYLDAHINLANALASQGKHLQALESFDCALRLNPSLPDVLNRRGAALSALNRNEEALRNHEQALSLKPDFPDALNHRGNSLAVLNRLDEALEAYAQALAADPKHVDALNNRGNVLLSVGRYEDALLSYDLAIKTAPDHVDALSNRANALRCLNRNEDALASCDLALGIQPDCVSALLNRGAIFRSLNRPEEALINYGRALVLAPSHADAYLHESLCRLLTGDFAKGWENYEWRWKSSELGQRNRNFAQPLWKGDSSLQGKTILLHAEQGVGDSIQFCRYVEMVEARGGSVVLEIPAPLQRLMSAGLAGKRCIVVAGHALPAFDLHCPLLSLPLAFKTEMANIPSATRYLTCDPLLQGAWKEKLGPRQKLRVGVMWSGNKAHKNDHNRSIPLERFLQIKSDHAEFFSLARDIAPNDDRLLSLAGVTTFGDELNDFADTAALISHMDLVISVDTSVAHLAGALGVPTWVLLPFSPDWRWLLNRADSPWYPTLRLIRQPAVADWAPVLTEVARDLCIMAMPRDDD